MKERLWRWFAYLNGICWQFFAGIFHRKVVHFVWPNGTEYWRRSGKFHREDGPSVILDDGSQFWHRKGALHREDGPAIIWQDGKQEWWLNGKAVRMETALDTPEKMEAYLLEESLRRL
jgi:hypothetical protein